MDKPTGSTITYKKWDGQTVAEVCLEYATGGSVTYPFTGEDAHVRARAFAAMQILGIKEVHIA